MTMLIRALVISSFALAANAFTIRTPAMRTTTLFSSDSHLKKDFTSGSGMNEHDIPLFINNLTKENFEASLEMLEPLLLNECVGEVCDDYMGELLAKSDSIGMTIPKDYAPYHH